MAKNPFIGDNNKRTGTRYTQSAAAKSSRARKKAERELREAAKVKSGTVGYGIGAGNGEVSDEAILNMAERQGKKR